MTYRTYRTWTVSTRVTGLSLEPVTLRSTTLVQSISAGAAAPDLPGHLWAEGNIVLLPHKTSQRFVWLDLGNLDVCSEFSRMD